MPLTTALAVETVWLGPSGDWTDPALWSLGVPGPGDTAVLGANTGTVTLDVDQTILGLAQDGGSLGGSGTLSVLGPARWRAGVHYGPGTTHFGGSLLLDGDATRTISGPRTTVVGGVATWTGNTAAGNGSLWLTTSGGVSTLRIIGEMIETQHFDHGLFGTSSGRIELQGRWHKLGGASTSISPSFHNDGEVRIDAGRLRLLGGGQHGGGFEIAQGAVLELAGGTHGIGATSAVNGAGVLHVSGGTAQIGALPHTANLLLSGGSLSGGDHWLQGTADFRGGSISGPGVTTFAGTSTISGGALKQLASGRTLALAGDAAWEGNTTANDGTLFLGSSGGATTLRVDATLNERQGHDHQLSGNGTLTIGTTGRWLKTSDTLSQFTSGVMLDNQGTVEVAAGTLRVARSFTNDGTLAVHAGAVFESTCFAGGGVCFRNAGLLHGSGVVQAPASGLENLGIIAPGHSIGTLTVDGPLRLNGSGAVHIELASLASFDQLVVTGAVALGGTLALWNAGYQPVLGDSFSMLTYGSGSGAFDQLSWTGFGSGVAFALSSGEDGVTLTVTAVPEPATALSLGLGLALLAAVARRRPTAAPGLR